MATGSRPPVRRSTRASLTRVWGIRLGIALAVGLIAGATAGIVGVNTLEPGRPQQADSLQLMIDSITSGKSPVAVKESVILQTERAVPAADSALANDNPVTIPDLVGVEEGAARKALTDSGLVVGASEFRESKSPLGTVLSTLPVFGASVKRGTSVNLILSDGRAPADSLLAPGFSHTP